MVMQFEEILKRRRFRQTGLHGNDIVTYERRRGKQTDIIVVGRPAADTPDSFVVSYNIFGGDRNYSGHFDSKTGNPLDEGARKVLESLRIYK